jgi:hypothetical protein
MTECKQEVKFKFDSAKRLEVRFSSLELSSDAGILLARQAEANEQVLTLPEKSGQLV